MRPLAKPETLQHAFQLGVVYNLRYSNSDHLVVQVNFACSDCMARSRPCLIVLDSSMPMCWGCRTAKSRRCGVEALVASRDEQRVADPRGARRVVTLTHKLPRPSPVTVNANLESIVVMEQRLRLPIDAPTINLQDAFALRRSLLAGLMREGLKMTDLHRSFNLGKPPKNLAPGRRLDWTKVGHVASSFIQGCQERIRQPELADARRTAPASLQDQMRSSGTAAADSRSRPDDRELEQASRQGPTHTAPTEPIPAIQHAQQYHSACMHPQPQYWQGAAQRQALAVQLGGSTASHATQPRFVESDNPQTGALADPYQARRHDNSDQPNRNPLPTEARSMHTLLSAARPLEIGRAPSHLLISPQVRPPPDYVDLVEEGADADDVVLLGEVYADLDDDDGDDNDDGDIVLLDCEAAEQSMHGAQSAYTTAPRAANLASGTAARPAATTSNSQIVAPRGDGVPRRRETLQSQRQRRKMLRRASNMAQLRYWEAEMT